MYCRLFQFDVRADRSDEFQHIAWQHIAGWLCDEPGKVQFHFVRDDAYNFRYYLFERYADPATHEARAQGALMPRHGERLAPLLFPPPLLLARGFEFCPSGRPADPPPG